MYYLNLEDKPPRPKSGYKLKIKKEAQFRNTTQGFGNFKRRDASRESSIGKSERNPMRESTMYFLKQVFNNKNESIQDEDDFYTAMKKTNGMSPRSTANDSIQNDLATFDSIKTPMSLLKMRRTTQKTVGSHKENESPRRMGHHLAGGFMSYDIRGLI